MIARRRGDLDAAETQQRDLLDWNRRAGFLPGCALALAELGFIAESTTAVMPSSPSAITVSRSTRRAPPGINGRSPWLSRAWPGRSASAVAAARRAAARRGTDAARGRRSAAASRRATRRPAHHRPPPGGARQRRTHCRDEPRRAARPRRTAVQRRR
ncbi:hypothetical protein V2I01_26125 [Micromonospora sp. BRA006-A]|nr:hypothetical protein [Micromonospora sp. BRA006-A]